LYYKGEKYESSVSNPGDFHGRGENIRKELIARIVVREGLRVLDVGTGFGSNAGFLSDILRDKGKIWTLDPSAEAIMNAEKTLREKRLGRNVTFVEGTTEKLPFEDGFFDLVVSVVVLHHLQGLEKGIKEMLRVLKKGGRLILVDWNPESHVLPFTSRHRKEDFFEPEIVASFITNDGASPTTTEFQYWYIVEATK
jgi:ubiquinone/menaquinone biosynthesis C-methylase UbiE